MNNKQLLDHIKSKRLKAINSESVNIYVQSPILQQCGPFIEAHLNEANIHKVQQSCSDDTIAALLDAVAIGHCK